MLQTPLPVHTPDTEGLAPKFAYLERNLSSSTDALFEVFIIGSKLVARLPDKLSVFVDLN